MKKMNSDHLSRFSKRYAILKRFTSWYYSLYYEEICIINSENVPQNDPVIFSPNHQNALMDALAIIYSTDKQPVFMARADIFKKDLIKKILHFLKIIPVYRIRDGIETLALNDSSFEQAFQVLQNNGVIGIMPEGNHGEQRRLRPLKKGIGRLAFQTQELLPERTVKIVPVGFDFSHYQNFRSNILVIYGKPILVKDYLAEYKENAAKGLQSLRQRITEDIRSLMIHIDSDPYYDTIYEAKEIFSTHFRKNYASLYEKFQLDKKVSDLLTSLAKENESQIRELKNYLDVLKDDNQRLGLDHWIYSWEPPLTKGNWMSDLGRYIVFAPVFLIATLFHYIPYKISEHYANKVEDKQFVSSMRFVVSFIAYLIWYLLFLCLPLSLYIKIILLAFMPILGVMSFDYYDSLKRARIKWKYMSLLKKKDSALNSAQMHYRELIKWITTKTGIHA